MATALRRPIIGAADMDSKRIPVLSWMAVSMSSSKCHRKIHRKKEKVAK
jgi:hypothetical protein